jgi:F420-non-reducing hydrogenase iron-sulfur subunit
MSQAEEATVMDERQWEPRILTLCCNWCSYAGADGAGVARMQYPPNARVIRVMCTGRINPLFIVKGFLSGADMVMVLGCHFGNCHYLKGNYACDTRMAYLKAYLQAIGINPDRLYWDQISASEGIKFTETMHKVVVKAKVLGPIANELGTHAKGAHADTSQQDTVAFDRNENDEKSHESTQAVTADTF